MRRPLLALSFGLAVAGALCVAVERRLRVAESAIDYVWDEPGRRYATPPHQHGANAHGFHERELDPADRSRPRVAVVGDSLTWGFGVPLEQVYPRVAEARLADGRELLNFGIYGYDIEQIAATTRYRVWDWAPDTVVYACYTNDAVPTRIIEVGGRTSRVWVGPALLPLHRSSALVRRLEGEWMTRRISDEPDLAFFAHHLAALAADVRDHGAAFVVLGLVPHVLADPDLDACGARLGRPELCHAQLARHRALLDVAAGQGLRVVETLPALHATGATAFYPDDPKDWAHYGAAGHAVLGEVLAGALR